MTEADGEREGEAEEEGWHQQSVEPLLSVLGQAPLDQGIVRTDSGEEEEHWHVPDTPES